MEDTQLLKDALFLLFTVAKTDDIEKKYNRDRGLPRKLREEIDKLLEQAHDR